MVLLLNNGATIRTGDIIKVQPLDPFFALLESPMYMVGQIISDNTIVTIDNNVIDLTTFRVVYVNGQELDKYTIDDIPSDEEGNWL
jgi:hypothetical protein